MWSIFFMLMLLVSVADSCRFGPDQNCAFPCRCKGAYQCDSQTGACLFGSSCQQSLPVGYGWRDPGCLIGNVAFNKSAKQSGQYLFYTADLAIDGYTTPYITNNPDESCANPFILSETNAWWLVDLGGLHNIQSITILNRLAYPGTSQPQDKFNERSTNYNISIGNTSDHSQHTLCFKQDKPGYQVQAVESMQCLSGDMVGRYVSFTRNGGTDPNQAAICEFIVMGHAVIDCDIRCIGKCDPIIGCDVCITGKKLPHCVQDCPDDYWGVNCANQCGKCRDGVVCDKLTGSCGDQCDGWYIPELCNKILEYPPHTVNQMSTYITSNSVRLSWDTSPWFFSDYQQFFYYIVVHRQTNSTSETWDTSDRIPFSNETSFLYDISGLTYNTEYEAQVVSYRKLNGMTDRGYIQTTEFKTLCTEPTIEETPVIIGSTDVFKIKWESVAIEIGCVYIINQQISIECHNSTHATSETLDIPINDKSFLYSAEYASRCYVRLLITNNAGLSASGMPVTVSDYSKTTMITKTDEYQSTMLPPADDTSNTSHSTNGAAITIGVVAMMVILVMTVVIAGLVISLRSTNVVSAENIYANGFNTKEMGLNEDTGAINPAYKENIDGEESDIQQSSVYEPLGNDQHDADTNTQGTELEESKVYDSLEDQIKELRSSEISGTSSSDDSDVYENTKIVESAHGRVNDLGRTPSEYMVMK